jgi:RNA-dependent RNA polymerase
VKASSFLTLQYEYASQMLKNYNIEDLKWDSKNLPDLLSFVNMVSSKISEVPVKGNELQNDPFILPLIKLVSFNKFSEVKEKFRIYDKNWCSLIGVIDPYNCLNEGEAFVQICKNVPPIKSENEDIEWELITGKVIVSKSPWVHPGDVRVLNCVSKNELKGYFNIIIFSCKGERPEPSKMAFGDLDGDVYWISWRENFVKKFVQRPPCNKNESKYLIRNSSSFLEPSETFHNNLSNDAVIFPQGGMKREDYIKNYIRITSNDYIGIIANLHSKFADVKKKSISEKNCLKLASLHQKAVDFAKNGQLLNFYELLEIKNSNRDRVDFLSKNKKNTNGEKVTKSPGILGQLFRNLNNQLNKIDLIETNYWLKIRRKYSLPSYLFENTDFLVYLKDAYLEIVRPYNAEIRKLMSNKGLFDESDLFSSNYAFSKMSTSRKHVYGKNEELKMSISLIKSSYDRKILNLFEERFKCWANFNINFKKAIHFWSYFDRVHMINDKRTASLLMNADFNKFCKLMDKEYYFTAIPNMTLKEFRKVVTRKFLTYKEISKIVEQTKILSAWWVLC